MNQPDVSYKMFTIIIAEDNDGLNNLIYKKLKREGYQCIQVFNGRQAINAINKDRNQILILDYKMPDLNGIEVIKTLKEKHQYIPPFIVMTGFGDEKIAVEMMKLGARDYFVKDGNFINVFSEKLKKIILEIELEYQLKENEQKYKNIFENIQDTYYEVTMDGIILEVSPSVKKLSKGQLTREDLLGINLIPFYKNPEERNLFLDELQKNDYINDFEIELKNKDGSVIYSSFSSKLIRDTQGRPLKIVGSIRDITDRKNAEIQLRDSEEYMKVLFESAPDAIYVHDLKGVFVNGNRAAEKLLGYAKEELIGKSFTSLNLLTKKYKEKAVGYLHDNAQGIEAGPDEFELIHKDGSRIPVEIRSFPVTILGNKRVIGVVRDISKRIEAEQNLRDNEQFLSNLLQVAPMGLTIVKNEQIDYINDRLCVLTGYNKGELLNKGISILFNNEKEYAGVRELQFHHLKDERVARIETKFKSKAGNMMDVALQSCYYDRHDTTKGLVIAVLDITEQKKNEAAVKLNEKRLESLLRIAQKTTTSIQDLLDYALNEAIDLTSSKIGYIYFYDEQKRQFTLNTWSKEVMKECRVRNQQVLYNLDDTGCWGEAVRQRSPIIINNYEANRHNPVIKGTPEGHVKLKKFLTIPVIMEGKIVAVAGVANKNENYDESDVRQLSLLMDSVWKISERVVLLNNYKLAKEKAEESDRLKSAFLANMSHEIRTPMNGILGFIDFLREPNLNGDEIYEYVDIIRKSGQRLLDTVSNLIDISRIETGQVEMKFEKIDVNSELQSLYNLFKEEARLKNLDFRLNLNCQKDDYIITSDLSKFNAIASNLIKNALKYTKEGSIEVGCKKNNSHFELYVKDTGIGIPEKFQESIFNRFVQAEQGYTRRYEGTGLGLSISKEYAKMLGGDISVISEKDKGSVFSLSLPIANNTIQKTDRQAIHNEPETKQTEDLTILIAEDDEVSRFHLELLLEPHSKKIYYAKTGKEAVAIAKSKNDIDLILMDIKMPDIDGYEAVEQIRTFNQKVPIIAQTAHAMEGDREKALEAGCNAYISKPLNKKELLHLIKKVTGKAI